MAAFSRSARMRNSCVHLLQCCNPEPVRCINRNSTAMPSATIPARYIPRRVVFERRASTMSEVARAVDDSAFNRASCMRLP